MLYGLETVDVTSGLYKTVTIFTVEFTLCPGLLPAVQYTCFPMSDFAALIDSADIVFTKPSYVIVAKFDWLVMSVDDMYHVMLAGG